jgi:hypothetical protein
VDIRHAMGAAALTGLVAAGVALTASEAAGAFDVDGVSVTVLESSDYMPPSGVLVVDGVEVAALESADYMPPRVP